jgi:hypothetical protein
MKEDSTTIIDKAIRDLDEALQRYENREEDTLAVAKRVRGVHRVLAEARSTLIRERVEAILAKPGLEKKDEEILQELFAAMIRNRSPH